MTTVLQLNEIRNRCKDKLLVVLFWASWFPESEEMKKALEKVAPNLSHIKICWCDVDKDKEIIDEYEVYRVPYILLAHVSLSRIIVFINYLFTFNLAS